MRRLVLASGLLLAGSSCNALLGLDSPTGLATDDGGGSDGDGSGSGSDVLASCKTAAMACDSSSTSPICDGATEMCRPCAGHNECASDVCIPVDFPDPLRAGSCAAAGEVAYVDSSGTSGTCSATDTCTIDVAATRNRRFIRVHGNVPGRADFTTPTAIFGDGGLATLNAGATGTSVITTTTDLEIYDLTLTKAVGDGVVVSGGATILERVRITGLVGVAVTAKGTFLTISRSKIDANKRGGIEVTDGGFDITNTFMFGNGDATPNTGSVTGGAFLNAATADSRFQYNTVADNFTKNQATNVAGVHCGAFVSGTVVAMNNILAQNTHVGQTGDMNTNLGGGCMFTNGLDDPNEINAGFVDTSAGDYHLGSASMALDKVTTAGSITQDFDGNTRPMGLKPDFGADERIP